MHPTPQSACISPCVSAHPNSTGELSGYQTSSYDTKASRLQLGEELEAVVGLLASEGFGGAGEAEGGNAAADPLRAGMRPCRADAAAEGLVGGGGGQSWPASRLMSSAYREEAADLLNSAVLQEHGCARSCAIERLLRQLVATGEAIRDANYGYGDGMRLAP